MLIDRIADAFRRKVNDEAGIMATATLISIGISLAVSAISYGIQALLAKRPPPVVGPRLDDLGAPTTNPGRNIPFAVGRNIAPGQIIWSTGLLETEHKEKVSGGKGGGPSTTVKTYTYSTSIAWAFNDGEICAVERIIAGGSKVLFSDTLLRGLTDAEINTQVDAKYDEVYAEELASLSAQENSDGTPRFGGNDAESIAARRAEIESENLREQLEAKNKDVKPRYDQIEIFYGTEDQEPSSIIEGVEGVGNVSAFRGTAYVVVENLQLADFGNFVPPVAIDYGTLGTAAGDNTTLTEGTEITAPTDGVADDRIAIDWTRGKYYITGFPASVGEILEFDLDTCEYVKSHTAVFTSFNGSAFICGIDETTGYLVGQWWGSTTAVEDWVYDPSDEVLITYFAARDESDATDADKSAITTNQTVAVINSPNRIASAIVGLALGSVPGNTVRAMTFPGLIFKQEWSGPTYSTYRGGGVFKGNDSTAWVVYASFGTDEIEIHKFTIGDLGVVSRSIAGTITLSDLTTITPTGLALFEPVAAYDPTGDALIISVVATTASGDHYGLVKWSETVGVIWDSFIAHDTSPSLSDYYLPNCRQSIGQTNLGDGRKWWVAPTGGAAADGDTSVLKFDLSDGSYTTEDLLVDFNSVNYAQWNEATGCYYNIKGTDVEPETTVALRKWCSNSICIDDPVSLTDVIDDFMQRAGYSTSEYEIDSAIDAETIWGFNDNSGRSSRDALEDLARIRPVIVNEIEGKIRFRLADQATVATIPKEDVRAYDGQSEPPAWISEVETLEDLALPKTLRIQYQNIDRSLNPAVSIFTREITQSDTVREFAVQAVDTAKDMRNSVFTAMSVLMSSKRSFKVSIPLKYAVLEPGDVVVIPISDARTARARVIRASLGANNIVELELSLYIDTSLGIQHTDQFDRTETDTATGVLDTTLHVLDIPYLTDSADLNADDEEDAGVYVAVGYQASGFPGANIYLDGTKLQTTSSFGTISQATGAPSWELAAQVSAPAQAGTIAKIPDPNVDALVKDIVSELIVTFETFGPSFASLTDAEILTSRDNALLVGNEIIQAQTVELITTGTYAFTNLYRGLQGTEWAIGTQAIGDRVVHLDPGALTRIDLANPDLKDFTVDFRAVTAGDDLTATTTTSELFDYASRKPYAPAIGDVARDESGNLTFELFQRNRYGADWNPDSPAFESDPQNFEVDIVVPGSPNVLRTLTVSDDTTISYTAAQQTTDFGAPQSAVTVRPYQLSALGFRGFTNEETI